MLPHSHKQLFIWVKSMDTTKEGRLEGTLCVRAQITADGVPFNVSSAIKHLQEEEK